MSTWMTAASVFLGGTHQIKSLVGARVRLRGNLISVPVFDPIHNTQDTTDLAPGSIGFVANPWNDRLLLAFPSYPGVAAATFAELQRSRSFTVVIVNEPTFKFQFDIEQGQGRR